MTTNAKINVLAAIVKDLILSMDPEDILATKRYNMLKDLDKILEEELEQS